MPARQVRRRTTGQPPYFWSFLALVVVLMIPAGHASAQTGDAVTTNSESAFAAKRLNLTGPKIVTDVAALTVKGKTYSVVLNVPDLDIYIDKTGRRYIPLLRLLRLLKARGGIEGDMVTFSASKGEKAQIDLSRGLLLHETQSQTIAIIKGVSDLTGQAELFVPESLIKSALGIDYSWSNREYAYTLTATRRLRLFEQIEQEHRRKREAIQPVSSNLMETEGVQTPEGSRQLISFIDASLRVDAWRLGNSQQHLFSITRPDVTLYGQIGGGNYYLNLGNNIVYPRGNFQRSNALGWATWINNGQWNYGATDTTVRVGDTIMGLSHLVFPSTKLSGLVVQGMLGRKADSDVGQRFLGGSRFSFMNQKRVSGYAPLGSKVDLYVNNRAVDSIVVDETPGAPPGQGAYDFVATGLLSNVLNEVRVVITQPDGTQDQHIENIVGSDALLPKGLSAYALALGTKRYVSNYSAQTHGMLAGGGFYYGLTRNATIGISLATQNDFAPNFVSSNELRLPARSYLGQMLAYRLFGNLLFREEEGVNYVPRTGDTSLATNLSLNYVTNPIVLSTYYFNYGQNYSNGVTDISNRRGFAVFGAPRLGSINLGATWAHIEQVSGDRKEDYLVSQATVPFGQARTQTFARLDALKRKNDPLSTNRYDNLTMYSFGLQTGPWVNTRFAVDYGVGDRINPVSTNDLRYGVTVPLIGSTPTYGTVLRADHSIGNYSGVSLIYRNYHQRSESAEIDVSRTPRRGGDVNVALRYRRNLSNRSDLAQINLEYPFDQRKNFVIGVNVNYSSFIGTPSYNMYLSMRDLFFYDRGTVGQVPRGRQINPQMGGLKGRVYLDANANGHYDAGEPGVPGVPVIVDGRTHYTSGPSGYFFVGRTISEDEAVVELDEDKLPAIYTPTQGRQRARWDSYVFTRAYLGVAVLGSVSGQVAQWQGGTRGRPIPGVVVNAVRVKDGTVVKHSITDSSGVYYLGQLKPGKYRLELQGDSVPPALHVQGELPRVSLPASVKPTDLSNIDIRLVAKH